MDRTVSPAVVDTEPLPGPTFRRVWRLAAVVLAPVPLLALASALLLRPVPPRSGLAAAVEQGTAFGPSLWLASVYAVLIVPATAVVIWAASRVSPRLGLAGGLLSLVGFAAGSAVPSADPLALIAAQQHLDPGRVVAIDSAVQQHPAAVVLSGLFLVGHVLGLALLAAGLWRGGAAPRWACLALGVSGPLHLLLSSTSGGAAASWALTAVGFAVAASGLVRAPGVGDLSRPWRMVIGVTAALAAGYVAVMRFLIPYDEGHDAPRVIFDKLLDATGYQTASVWLGLLVLPLAGSGVFAVAWLTRRRAPLLTTLGFALAVPGYFALFAAGPYGDLLNAVVSARPDLDRDIAFALGWGLQSDPRAGMLGLVFVVGHLVGTVFLGLAALRSRVFPRWLAIGLTVSQPIHLTALMLGIRPLDLLGWGLTTLAFGYAGWRVAQGSSTAVALPVPSVVSATAALGRQA